MGFDCSLDGSSSCSHQSYCCPDLFTSQISGPTSAMNLTQATRWNLGDPSFPGRKMKYYEEKDFTTDFTPGFILNLNLSNPQ